MKSPIVVLREAGGVLCWNRDETHRLVALSPPVSGIAANWRDGLPPWRAHVHADDLEHVASARDELACSSASYRIEYRLYDPVAGDCAHVVEIVHGRPDGGANGVLLMLDGERALAASDALTGMRRREERFRALTRLSADWFWETDEEDRFVYVSDGVTRVLGLTSSEILGRTRQALIGSDDQAGIAEARRKVAAHEPFRGLRYQIVAADGQRRHLEIAGEPRYEDGRFTGYHGIAHDVTADVERTRALQRANRRLRDVIETTPAGYVEVGADGLIRNVNPAMCEMCGRDQRALIGHPAHALFPDLPDAADLADADEVVLAHGLEMRLLTDNGGQRHVSLNARIEFDDDGGIEAMTAFVTDITAHKQAQTELERLAMSDPVTGLFNRSFLERRLQTVLETAPRRECNAVIFIDLDRFKEVNDTLGHEAGDALLRELGNRLRLETRPGDIVARFGGDEFIVVAHCADGENSAQRIAEKLCAAISRPVVLDEGAAEVGASIGIALFPRDGDDADTLFRKADLAMYSVKRSGRNGWRVYDASLEEDTAD